MPFQLLTDFEAIFAGQKYIHRNQAISTRASLALYEDLLASGLSPKFTTRVQAFTHVVAPTNDVVGKKARRGDGTFGPLVHKQAYTLPAGRSVAQGTIASIQVGTEMKILAKAMMKQVNRVVSDLTDQVQHFRRTNRSAITIGIVGVNHAGQYVGYEGDREYPTTGKGSYKHPIQEAAKAIAKLNSDAAPEFDEFIILDFEATNAPPFPFSWVSATKISREYGALLTRVAGHYESRF